MKKNFIKLFTVAALSLFIFTGCNVDIDNSFYRTAVTVESRPNDIIIAFPKINTTDSITIYRINAETKQPKNPTKDDPIGDEGTIIGVVYPDQYPNEEVYIFTDAYSKVGGKYSYRVRYNNPDGEYSYTKWSDTVKTEDGMGLTYELGFNNTSNLIYDAPSKSLKLDSPILWNNDVADDIKDKFNMFHLALECAEEQEAFLFPVTEEQFKAQISIPLSTIIPLSWYDKQISVKGIVAVTEIKDAPTKENKNPKAKQQIFTPATALKLFNEKNEAIEFISYASTSKEGTIPYL